MQIRSLRAFLSQHDREEQPLMTTPVFVPVEIPRDHFKRPKIIPAAGGKPVAYTRCTTFVGCLEDNYNLQRWSERHIAKGFGLQPNLAGAAAITDDKNTLNKLVEDAKDAAEIWRAALHGSTVHALTERLDRGQPIPAVGEVGYVDDAGHIGIVTEGMLASLEAYRQAMAGFKMLHIERFCVLDTLKIGGTPDRVVSFNGEAYIADVKTGSIEWGTLKMAMQLAVYARSFLYDPANGGREVHGASTTRGIIIHLPAVDDPAEARCDLHWIDIETGWKKVLIARDVREARGLKFAHLTKPFDGKPARPSLRLEKKDDDKPVNKVKHEIDRCITADDVRHVWAQYAEIWNEELTLYAKERISALEFKEMAT
jgi:hypothetical protein